MLFRRDNLVIGSCLVLLGAACTQEEDETIVPESSVREIIHITGNLYEARDPAHNTVFLVTPDGVILGDPMGVESAQWIKEQIAERFDATVEYVIYSHHHPEHSTGGNVFEDTATFVAHENTIAALNAPFPSNAGQMDLDGDGRIERADATAPGYGGAFDGYDRNGDGFMTGDEITADRRHGDECVRPE